MDLTGEAMIERMHLFLHALHRALIMSPLGLPLVANNTTPFISEPQI
ncbi:MAG: hypothetical protein WAR76_10905 [Xanthobacteraceae bacterium]